MKGILFTSMVLLSALTVQAQSFYNINSNVFISAGTTFTVGDSLVNKGTLTNNGNMVMGGVWINTGTYNPGTGEITFNNPPGGKSQIINHNNQSFNKLTINGGGEKLILADMTVVGELNLVNGVIANQNNSKVIFQSGAKIVGGSDQSHINGPVEQQGSGDLYFPIGNGVVYLPVQISGVTDTKVKATITLHELSENETLVGADDIIALSSHRYWEFGLTDGLLNGSTLTLPLRNEEALPGDDSQLIVAESITPLGEYQSLGQSSFTGTKNDGLVTSEVPPTTTFFTIGVLNDEVSVTVFNGVSPNDDGLNDYFKLLNIKRFPDNTVTIFNRWGDKVFELSGYDDDTRVFKGENNLKASQKLPSGIYFYSIKLGNGTPALTGYLELKN